MTGTPHRWPNRPTRARSGDQRSAISVYDRRPLLGRRDTQSRRPQTCHQLTASYRLGTSAHCHLPSTRVKVIVIALKRPTRHTGMTRNGVQFVQISVADHVAPLSTAPPPTALVNQHRHGVSDRRSRHRSRHHRWRGPAPPALLRRRPRRRPRVFSSNSGGQAGRPLDRSIRSSNDAFRRKSRRSCSDIRKRP